MAIPVHVLKDSTQTLVSYPPVLGIPSSVTVRIQTPSTALPLAASAESITVDATSSTTNAAALEGAVSLAFASDPTATAGRRYLVTDATDGHAFDVEVRKTGSTVYLKDPLPRAVASGSSLDGIACPHALTTAETSELGSNGLAVWNGTIGGQEYEWRQHFIVVYAAIASPLTPARLVRARPDAQRLRPPTDEGFDEAIAAAFADIVFPRLEARGVAVERVRSWDLLEPAHQLAVIAHLYQVHERFEEAETLMAEMDVALKLAAQNPRFYVDDADGSGREDDTYLWGSVELTR